MKRLLFIPLIFLCSALWAADSCKEPVQLARMNPYIAGAGVSAVTCTSCTGGLLFAAYFEDASGDVTLGSPCGCSVGDTTGAATDSCTITGGYLYSADTTKHWSWDVSSNDIIKPTAGSILLKFRVETWVDQTELFAAYEDTNNRISIYLHIGDEVFVMHKGNSTEVAAQTSGTNTAVINTDYWLVVRWTTADVDPNLKIELYNGTTKALIDDGTSNTNCVDFANVLGAGDFKVGNRTTNNGSVRIYSIKVWDTYAGAPTSSF